IFERPNAMHPAQIAAQKSSSAGLLVFNSSQSRLSDKEIKSLLRVDLVVISPRQAGFSRDQGICLSAGKGILTNQNRAVAQFSELTLAFGQQTEGGARRNNTGRRRHDS